MDRSSVINTWRLTRTRCCTREGSFDNLTDDLFALILLKLSLKSLHRFKCVAKRWLSIISSPFFARASIAQHPPSTLTLFEYSRDRVRQVSGFTLDDAAAAALPVPLSFEFIPPLGEWMLLQSVALKGSCGGLVLVEAKFQNSRFFYVCNPLTKHWMQLPRPVAKPGRVGFTCYYLGRQPNGTTIRLSANSEASTLSLFNYDPNKIHFTCVLVTKNYKDDFLIIYVFHSSSEIAEWRAIRVPLPFGYSWAEAREGDPALFSNGVFHLDGVSSIAAYDPFYAPNHCHIIPLPPLDSPKDGSRVFDRFMAVTSEGCLRMGMNFMSGIFEVWELVDYAKKTWALKYNLDVKYPGRDYSCIWFQSFTGVDGDEAYFVDIKYLIIMVFNLRTRSLQPVYSLPVESGVVQHLRNIQPSLLNSWSLLQHLAHKLPLSCSTTVPEI